MIRSHGAEKLGQGICIVIPDIDVWLLFKQIYCCEAHIIQILTACECESKSNICIE